MVETDTQEVDVHISAMDAPSPKQMTDAEVRAELMRLKNWQNRGEYAESLAAERGAQIATLRSALESLANEAQILVNIIQTNTDPIGRCTLDFDMTVGTRKAIEAARKLLTT